VFGEQLPMETLADHADTTPASSSACKLHHNTDIGSTFNHSALIQNKYHPQ
jgi:hypothetical protein